METLRSIDDNLLNEKPLEWFKDEYLKIRDAHKKKQRDNALYATKYYRKHRNEILAKRKTTLTLKKEKESEVRVPRPRGRPRKYTEEENEADSDVLSN